MKIKPINGNYLAVCIHGNMYIGGLAKKEKAEKAFENNFHRNLFRSRLAKAGDYMTTRYMPYMQIRIDGAPEGTVISSGTLDTTFTEDLLIEPLLNLFKQEQAIFYSVIYNTHNIIPSMVGYCPTKISSGGLCMEIKSAADAIYFIQQLLLATNATQKTDGTEPFDDLDLKVSVDATPLKFKSALTRNTWRFLNNIYDRLTGSEDAINNKYESIRSGLRYWVPNSNVAGCTTEMTSHLISSDCDGLDVLKFTVPANKYKENEHTELHIQNNGVLMMADVDMSDKYKIVFGQSSSPVSYHDKFSLVDIDQQAQQYSDWWLQKLARTGMPSGVMQVMRDKIHAVFFDDFMNENQNVLETLTEKISVNTALFNNLLSPLDTWISQNTRSRLSACMVKRAYELWYNYCGLYELSHPEVLVNYESDVQRRNILCAMIVLKSANRCCRDPYIEYIEDFYAKVMESYSLLTPRDRYRLFCVRDTFGIVRLVNPPQMYQSLNPYFATIDASMEEFTKIIAQWTANCSLYVIEALHVPGCEPYIASLMSQVKNNPDLDEDGYDDDDED